MSSATPVTPEPYALRIAPGARRALTDRLPAAVAFAAFEFINGPLRISPYRVGKPLHEPFEGLWSARRGTYRIRYSIDEKARTIDVLDIAPRADAYRT
ncbi:type II toxin-antitoxin system RelE family toxin [Yinghuangia soli]|uniref:Type II toxin-antitoxin system RelE/ParE family toxin n=1 Tax=Yinghuangia soli TaxID=2908204 RepID=A0AA41PZW6_9ACTN|nr:type II toxin-antitoxin system RelE/ParE family toxin [Yinghuangia soli]MCF2528410.1 type II toxin-antitoxin system RelE/ParE family toxin [Yinghuangia soli]